MGRAEKLALKKYPYTTAEWEITGSPTNPIGRKAFVEGYNQGIHDCYKWVEECLLDFVKDDEIYAKMLRKLRQDIVEGCQKETKKCNQ